MFLRGTLLTHKINAKITLGGSEIYQRELLRLPVNYSCPVQMFNCQDKLPDIFACFMLLKPLFLVDLVHQVATRTQLHNKVVAVFSFQYIQQLSNIGVADHLLDLPFPSQILGDIGVFFGSFLVNYFHCHLM